MQRIESEKLYVYVIPERTERRRFHQYLEKFHPELAKISLRCNKFKLVETYLVVCECNYVGEVKYTYGIESNNSDEWYRGRCDNCGESLYRDCGDGCVMSRLDSNVVVVGNKETFMKIGAFHDKKTRFEEKELVLIDVEPVVIDAPNKKMRKNDLIEWVNEHI